MLVYIDNCTSPLRFKKGHNSKTVGIIMLKTGRFLWRRFRHDTWPCLHQWKCRI